MEDADVFGEYAVEGAKENVDICGRCYKMGDLASSMDAGIGAAGRSDRNFLMEGDLKGVFDEGLNGNGVKLDLPSTIGCPVVGDEYFIF